MSGKAVEDCEATNSMRPSPGSLATVPENDGSDENTSKNAHETNVTKEDEVEKIESQLRKSESAAETSVRIDGTEIRLPALMPAATASSVPASSGLNLVESGSMTRPQSALLRPQANFLQLARRSKPVSARWSLFVDDKSKVSDADKAAHSTSIATFHTPARERAEDLSPSVMNNARNAKLYTVYRINVRAEGRSWCVHKRYSEFRMLDAQLLERFSLIHKTLPDLPPKRLILDNLDPEFIERRARGLNAYIQAVFRSPVLLRSDCVRHFLNLPVHQPPSPPPTPDEESIHHQNQNQNFHQQFAADVPTPPPEKNESSLQKITAPIVSLAKHFQRSLNITSSLSDSNVIATSSNSFFSFVASGKQQQQDFESHQGSINPLKQYRLSSDDDDVRSSNHTAVSMLYPSKTPQISLQDFYLLKLIGKGNFGKVMLAQHKNNHQVYAIKVISKASVKVPSPNSPDGQPAKSSPNDIQHIMSERNVLIRSIHHPFLIGLRWAFQTEEKLYFVTDYVNGGELFFHLQREKRFSELRSRFYAAEITSALEYLHVHMDVVYRDLKPENILLDASGHILLTDFGLAKENLIAENNGRTQTFCGTPEYLAVEVLRKESYGFPVDWWCLGAVLYEMLVGIPPFYSKNTPEMYEKILKDKLRFPSHINTRARSLISGLLHKSPYFRLGTGPNNTSSPNAVKTHPFFEGIDWGKLVRKEYQPPFVPTVLHTYDLRNIDPQFVNEAIPKSVLDDCVMNTQPPILADFDPSSNGNEEMGSGLQDGGLEVEVSGVNGVVGRDWFRGFTFIGDDGSKNPSMKTVCTNTMDREKSAVSE